jgi:apolipoprotein N-acyltransferase
VHGDDDDAGRDRVTAPADDIQFPQRRPGNRCSARAAFIFTSAVALSLAFAPWPTSVHPWPPLIAWVALAPWLAAVASASGIRSAALWGGMGGILFFAANLWWLWTATIPGAVGTVIYFAMFWALAAGAIRVVGLNVLAVAAVWTAVEWLRTRASGGFQWLMIGHSQARLPIACQIADACGAYGVSFAVGAANAAIAAWFVRGRIDRRALVTAGTVIAVVLAYGALRLSQETTTPGPRVMVVQSNFPFRRGGARTASREQSAEFHLRATAEALARASESDRPDLVVWSEAVMPPLNPEARDELRRASVGPFLESTHRRISELAAAWRVAIVTGGYYVGAWTRADASSAGAGVGAARTATDIRNSAFVYTADGAQSSQRYDKVALVPFAEHLPFASWSPAWARPALLWLSAPSARQPDTPGDPAALTVFSPGAGVAGRFVTPICFENVDAAFIGGMLRGSEGKRADFIVNLTNDGWFAGFEHEHHFRAALALRAIENRVPIARSSNTGISGFVDPCGRVIGALPIFVEGTLTARLPLDRRATFYMRFGDVFALFCALGAAGTILFRATRGHKMM